MSNYATKSEVATCTDTSGFTKKTDLRSLKSAIGKLDIGSLKTVPTDLNKLSDLVDNGVVKKTVYDEFFTWICYMSLLNLFIVLN